MAKFAMVASKEYSSKNIKSFEKRFSEDALKKKFKCKNVISIKDFGRSFEEVENILKIKKRTLENLSALLWLAERDDLIEDFQGNFSSRKYFIFTDDAEHTAFADDYLKDDVCIITFSLNQSQAEELIEMLEEINSTVNSIEKLNEAESLIDSIKEIEFDTDLDLIRTNAESEIFDKKYDLEELLENLRSDVHKIAMSSW